jgi:hypothetical protein
VSTLQQIRDKVRTQADLDTEDLPDGTLDGFIREAFDRTFAVEARWPFFEHEWTVNKADGETTIDVPTSPGVAFIQRMRDSGGYNLLHLDSQQAEESFQGEIATSSEPTYFSIWGGVMKLWPTPSTEEMTFTLRGYRKPTWTGVAGDELDGDSRLHLPIFHYAVGLAYAQLEDPELESTYMQRWGSSLNDIRANIMRPQHQEPLILNGGTRIRRTRRVERWGDLV